VWNSIPVSIQTITFTGFKKNYKQMLINKYVMPVDNEYNKDASNIAPKSLIQQVAV